MDRPAPPDGDVNRNSVLIGVSWTLATLAAICVSLRFYSRVLITRNPWWDDWAILATMVSSMPRKASKQISTLDVVANIRRSP